MKMFSEFNRLVFVVGYCLLCLCVCAMCYCCPTVFFVTVSLCSLLLCPLYVQYINLLKLATKGVTEHQQDWTFGRSVYESSNCNQFEWRKPCTYTLSLSLSFGLFCLCFCILVGQVVYPHHLVNVYEPSDRISPINRRPSTSTQVLPLPSIS